MEANRLRYGLLANHSRLVLKLDPVAVMPYLISDGLVSMDEKEVILSKTTGGEKTDALLTLVHRKAVSDKSVYERFLSILGDDILSGGQQLDNLVAQIRRDAASDGMAERYRAAPSRLDPRQKAALQAEEKALVSSLNAEELVPDLVSCGVLSLDENEVIRAGATYSERAQLLVQLMHQKSAQQFVRFVELLTSSENYAELGRRLLVEGVAVGEEGGWEGDPEKYVVEVLKRGHVPPRHGVYVDRPEMTEHIRAELRQLKNTDGWVVVHGMAGFGKTILAAEAIRDASLLKEVFPGGVHWLAVGQMITKDGEIDKVKLLTRLQNLIVRLDEKVTRPPNLEAANNTLQRILSEQYPRSLLVLDDVWSPEVAQSFSVRCRTMVTSRNSAVASMVHTPHVQTMSLTQGFTDDEGILLLAKWLDRDPKELPKDAETIIEYCRGSPMVIALIGAILKKNPTSDRKWKLIVEKLKKKHFHSIKLHASVNEWSYQHATLNASIELSVESLPEHLQELFEMFVVFDYNTLVSSRALETIWNRDSLETDELLMELVGLSLVQQASPSDAGEYIVFIVNDIVLDYLRQTVPSNKQVEHHRAVVRHYSESKGAYSLIPDDGYVYQKLLTHIAASENYDLLGDLLSQLSWLIATAKTGNSMSMLADYRLYKASIPEQFAAGVQQFEFFVSGHMDVLANDPSPDDIVQLALLQPNASEVFVQASARVKGDRKKSWFKWSNKESDPEKYVLKLKVHRAGVKKCQYSRDGGKVVSCSNDFGVKLWDASTGMELADFRGHSDMVTCCAISDSGRLVISSSEDTTVRVWDTHRKRSIVAGNERVKKSPLLLEFKGHQYGVQSCAISGERLVMSADIDSCVLLWEPLSGKVVSRWRLSSPSPMVSPVFMDTQPSFPPVYMPLRSSSPSMGTEGVLSCAFSPDGTLAVTGTQSGSVILWKTEGQLLSSLKGHSSHVRCCVFDQTGTFLATACSGDSSAKIWEVATSQCVNTLTHSCPVLCCDFSPDQERLVTGNTDGVVSVWSVSEGTLLEEHLLHSDHVNCVLFSPTQPHILSAADNGIIKIQWNDSSEVTPRPRTPHTHYHRRFSTHFSKGEAGYKATILCYIPKLKELQLVQSSQANVVLPSLPTLEGHTPRSWNLSADGSLVVVGFEKGALQVISVLQTDAHHWKGAELWHVDHAHNKTIRKAFFSPNNTKIVTCSENQHKTWSVKSGERLAEICGTGLGVKPVIFFNDSVRIASAQENGVLIWSSETGKEGLRCEGIVSCEESVLCLNLSGDNRRLVASNSIGLVMVWSTETGEALLKSDILPLSPCARSCALSPDGSMAAAGFDDGSLKIWYVLSVEKSKLLAHCPTYSSYWMIDVDFSPDGKKVVTLCDTIEWWHTTGKHMKTIRLKGSFGKYIRFSPDFKTFVTIDNAGLLYILDTLA